VREKDLHRLDKTCKNGVLARVSSRGATAAKQTVIRHYR